MRRHAAAAMLANALLAACEDSAGGGATDAHPVPPRVAVDLDELRTVGEAADDPRGVLGQPAFVRTDGDGRVYVVDLVPMQVKVFAPDGAYLRSIGGRGRDAGGFLHIAAMELTERSELLVADVLAERLTRFDAEGRVLAIHDLRGTGFSPRELRSLGGGRFVGASIADVELDGGWFGRRRRLPLLHVGEDGGAPPFVSFADAADLVGDDPIALLLTRADPGSLAVDSDGSVLFAPRLYRGRIHRYVEGEAGWRAAEPLRGLVHGMEPFDRVEAPAASLPGGFRIRMRHAEANGLMRNESRGLVRLAEGTLAHFTLIADERGRTFGVELFDRRGRLTGYGPLVAEPYGTGGGASLPLYLAWRGDGDLLYLIDRRGEIPVVRVVRLLVRGATPGEPAG